MSYKLIMQEIDALPTRRTGRSNKVAEDDYNDVIGLLKMKPGSLFEVAHLPFTTPNDPVVAKANKDRANRDAQNFVHGLLRRCKAMGLSVACGYREMVGDNYYMIFAKLEDKSE